MGYNDIKKRLEEAGQEQLLRFYDELKAEEKDILLDEISKIDFDAYDINYKAERSSNIMPIDAMTLDEIDKRRTDFENSGIDAIKKCKVAAVLLAGGQGTRLGFDGPKGTLNVGINNELFLFEIIINNLSKALEKAGTYAPLLIMTSEINDKATREFFEEHDYFGYNKDMIFFFVQEMAPATDMEGKILLDEKAHVALSPNGNGGWFNSIIKAGLLEKIKSMGVEWLNVFAVDNVLQKMLDASFIGAVIESGYPSGSKVVRKASPDEKVGVMCLRDNKPSIVEYFELTEDMLTQRDENGNLSYNYGVILNYLFKIEALEEISSRNLPYYVVDKKIPYIDDGGNKVMPDEPNGHKFEMLILDMVEMMDGCLVYEVERNNEFAPIKNATGKDSLDTARKMLEETGVKL